MEKLGYALLVLCIATGCDDDGSDTPTPMGSSSSGTADSSGGDPAESSGGDTSTGNASSTGPECTEAADCGEEYLYSCIDGECIYEDPCGEWIVGEQGEMRGIRQSGAIQSYPFEGTEDLFAIACRGERKAWVVGENGILLRTVDEGDSWIAAEVPITSTLRAVIASEAGPIYAAGDEGVLLVSADEGMGWSLLPAPGVDWTGVATTALGEMAVLTGRDGSIWRHTALGSVLLFSSDGRALHSVSMTPDGLDIVAAGDDGLLLRSSDAGASWQEVPLLTALDLLAVQVARDGTLIFATGESGVFVRVDHGDVSVEALLDPALSLYDVHINGEGDGNMVGDFGLVFETKDSGLTWDPVDLGTDRTLYSVDEVGRPHI